MSSTTHKRSVPTLKTFAAVKIKSSILKLGKLTDEEFIDKSTNFPKIKDKYINQISKYLSTNLDKYTFNIIAYNILMEIESIIESRREAEPRMNYALEMAVENGLRMDVLMNVIRNEVGEDSSSSSSDESESSDESSDGSLDLQNYVGNNLPKSELSIWGSITQIFLNRMLLKVGNLDWPLEMCSAVVKKMWKLTGVQTVILASNYLQKPPFFNRCIIEALPEMAQLRSVTITNHCSNAIIAAIAKSCPQIESIEFHHLREDGTTVALVNDKSVRCLIQCKRLKNLNTGYSLISNGGIAEIMVRIPTLQRVIFHNRINQVIEEIKVNTFWNREPLKICEVYVDSETNINEDFLTLFPKLTSLRAYLNELGDLNHVISFENLKELYVQYDREDGEPLSFDLHFSPFLEKRGAKLTDIVIDVSSQVFCFDIIVGIAAFCPQLKTLKVDAVKILDDNDYNSPEMNVFEITPFQDLVELKLDGEFDLDQVKFLLRYAYSLKKLHLGNVIGVTPEFLDEIMNFNPLKYLKMFNIRGFRSQARKIFDICLERVAFMEMID